MLKSITTYGWSASLGLVQAMATWAIVVLLLLWINSNQIQLHREWRDRPRRRILQIFPSFDSRKGLCCRKTYWLILQVRRRRSTVHCLGHQEWDKASPRAGDSWQETPTGWTSSSSRRNSPQGHSKSGQQKLRDPGSWLLAPKIWL